MEKTSILVETPDSENMNLAAQYVSAIPYGEMQITTSTDDEGIVTRVISCGIAEITVIGELTFATLSEMYMQLKIEREIANKAEIEANKTVYPDNELEHGKIEI